MHSNNKMSEQSVLVGLEFDYAETTKTMDIFCQKDIDHLRQWITTLDKSKYVPKDLTNKQIVLFYNASFGDIEKTKVSIEKYYSCRKSAPELFDHRIWNADLKKASEVPELFHLPGPSCEGYEIIFHRLHDRDSSNFDLERISKLLLMVVDLSLSKRGPRPGYIVLFDMEGIKLGHITRLNLSTVRKLFQYVQEAVPVRVRAIHVLNSEPVLDKLLALTKPFIDSKLFEMIKFHKKNENLEKLYEIVPQSSLPSDYGGSLEDTQTLHKRCMKELQLLEDYFKAEEQQRFAALPVKITANTLQGSFRKLDID